MLLSCLAFCSVSLNLALAPIVKGSVLPLLLLSLHTDWLSPRPRVFVQKAISATSQFYSHVTRIQAQVKSAANLVVAKQNQHGLLILCLRTGTRYIRIHIHTYNYICTPIFVFISLPTDCFLKVKFLKIEFDQKTGVAYAPVSKSEDFTVRVPTGVQASLPKRNRWNSSAPYP